MAETSPTFKTRSGDSSFTIGEGGFAQFSDPAAPGGTRTSAAQWQVQPGGIYQRVDPGASGQNIWIDPRTRQATSDPMEGQLTGLGGGQFFTDPNTGFRLTQAGDVWSGKYGTQRVVPASGDSPYRQVLHPGDVEGVTGARYIDEYGVMRRGALPGSSSTPGGTPTSGASVGEPIIGEVSRGGAPGYPSVGEGGLIGGGTGGAAGAPGPTTQADTPGQAPVQAATPYVLGQTQPVTPQPTASAVLSDPVQSRLQQLRGPQDQVAAQAGMTQEQDINWQMNRILEAGNPIINRAMEQARRNVQTEMNARGLSNTSMAVEMAEKSAWDAAYNIALPMAQDAARAEQQTASANLQSRAAFQQTGMQLRSQEAQQRAQLASGEIIQNLVNNNQITLKEIDRITQLQGIQLSEENKRLMHQITEGNKLALQTNASVATAYSNTVSAIGQVYSNPELDGAQQNAAAQWYMDQFQGYTEFQDIVNDTNYAAQLDWGGRSGTGLVAGTAAGSQQAAPGEFSPFGVVGAPGEVRTIVAPDPTGRTAGREQNYKWNETTGTWQSTAPGFLPSSATSSGWSD